MQRSADSVTALTAIAVFIGHIFGFGLGRGLILFAFSIPVISAVNICRVVLSGIIQETAGVEYILGYWHKALGMFMVLPGTVLVVQLARLLSPRTPPPDALESPESEFPAEPSFIETMPTQSPVFRPVMATRHCSARPIGCDDGGSKSWRGVSIPIRRCPRRSRTSRSNWAPGSAQDSPVDASVKDSLACDKIFLRNYKTTLGYSPIDCWVIY